MRLRIPRSMATMMMEPIPGHYKKKVKMSQIRKSNARLNLRDHWGATANLQTRSKPLSWTLLYFYHMVVVRPLFLAKPRGELLRGTATVQRLHHAVPKDQLIQRYMQYRSIISLVMRLLLRQLSRRRRPRTRKDLRGVS